jgi:deazaflavin-dependent oxidoreductase (nitroreductase family)
MTPKQLWYVALGELATSRAFYPVHRAIYRLSSGRVPGRAMGCPVVLLTTAGRRTGNRVTTPVYGFPDGAAVVVVASNAGKDRHPSWYLNLRAKPDCEVQIGREIRRARAREATPEERERLWPELVRRYGGYDAYRARTDRSIPVLFLERP